MTGLDRKLKHLFGELAVDKKLSQLNEVARLPRFIGEYLVGKFCQDDPSQGVKRLGEFVEAYYPEPKDKDKVLHELMTNGEYNLIDEFKVEAAIKEGTYKLIIPCLNLRDARILKPVIDAHENLLGSGMWGFATLNYMPDLQLENSSSNPVVLTKFTPFQASKINFNEFAEKREEFSTEEWIDVLINTLGLSPDAYDRETKFVLLSRLVPLVEPNVNMIELGPRATGKTYLYRNISYYTRIFAGGKVSPAVLFYHIPRKTVGDIGIKDCIAFDELSRISFSNPDEMMGKMKDYMVDGFVERGEKKLHATCSLVFMGNIEAGEGLPTENFTEALPPFMKDSAFIDRVHGFIPGWRLPKLMKAGEHLSRNYGLISDYFCEIMHNLRRKDFEHIINEHVQVSDNATFRDERGIRKIASGMLKILCPHGKFSEEDLRICMDLAIEYRQRIGDWLSDLSPGEFKRKKLAYKIKTDTGPLNKLAK